MKAAPHARCSPGANRQLSEACMHDTYAPCCRLARAPHIGRIRPPRALYSRFQPPYGWCSANKAHTRRSLHEGPHSNTHGRGGSSLLSVCRPNVGPCSVRRAICRGRALNARVPLGCARPSPSPRPCWRARPRRTKRDQKTQARA
eukprot:176032-Chlamydomonas_euryale.AAC.1